LLTAEDFAAIGINPTMRAEVLSVADFSAIANYVHNRHNTP
jgi:16S rRNA A1518/A1519 N6-dimethyltransferase RsmA/KsgA/DIM1 with predicted DNA glycosylase/AP lyase activity